VIRGSVGRGVRALLVVASAIPLAGCMERALLVRTDPPGARVWVNGVDRGTTPLRLRYVRDGRFRIRIEKAGYETVADEVVTRTAIDAVPGPDFFFENGPGRRVRETAADYRLVPLAGRPMTDADLDAVRLRGEAFRLEAEAAATEPGTPAPARPHERPAPLPKPPPAPPSADRSR
jgi:hypothetical protein